MYSIDTLEHGIKKCKENIKIFEDAIDKERDSIKEYRIMMDVLDKKKRQHQEMLNNVHIEIDNSDN